LHQCDEARIFHPLAHRQGIAVVARGRVEGAFELARVGQCIVGESQPAQLAALVEQRDGLRQQLPPFTGVPRANAEQGAHAQRLAGGSVLFSQIMTRWFTHIVS
jgi:hypothetical protein